MQPPDEDIPVLVLAINWENIEDTTLSFNVFIVVFPLVPVTGPVRGRKHDPVWPFLHCSRWTNALSLKFAVMASGKKIEGIGGLLLRQCVCRVFLTLPQHGQTWAALRSPHASVHSSLPKTCFSSPWGIWKFFAISYHVRNAKGPSMLWALVNFKTNEGVKQWTPNNPLEARNGINVCNCAVHQMHQVSISCLYSIFTSSFAFIHEITSVLQFSFLTFCHCKIHGDITNIDLTFNRELSGSKRYTCACVCVRMCVYEYIYVFCWRYNVQFPQGKVLKTHTCARRQCSHFSSDIHFAVICVTFLFSLLINYTLGFIGGL